MPFLLSSPAGPPTPVVQAAPAPAAAPPPRANPAAVERALAQSPVRFVDNVGQFAGGARFRVYGGGPTLWLGEDALWVTGVASPPRPLSTAVERGKGLTRDPLSRPQPGEGAGGEATRAVALKLTFPDANPHPTVEPFDRLETKVSYFLGNDPEKWRPDVPVWGGVRYRDVYPGLDLEVLGEGGRWTWRMAARTALGAQAASAALARVQLRVEGADAVAVEDGTVRLTTAIGEVRLPLVAIAKELSTDSGNGLNGRALVNPFNPFPESVDSSFAAGTAPVVSGHTVAHPFAPLGSSGAAPAGVQPAGSSDLAYSTFLGGSDFALGRGIAVDGTGAAYVTGSTLSSDFPTTAGAFDTSFSGGDVFVAKVTIGAPGYFVSGRIRDTNNNPVSGVTISTGSGVTAATDASGYYTITDVLPGTYVLTPISSGLVFWPPSLRVGVSTNLPGQDFTALDELGDADGDGLPNGWEVKGYDFDGDGLPDVDLPAMGANPLRKDLFVEVDYMVEYKPCQAGLCVAHTHRPRDEAIARVVQAFANAPVSNPDGSGGITLHVDYGPDTPMAPARTFGTPPPRWGSLSRSDAIPHQETLQPADRPWTWAGFDHIKNDQGHFDRARARIFHYAIFAHALGGSDNEASTSGISRNDTTNDAAFRRGASDLVVSLGRWKVPGGTASQQAGTFMHELGHNLGLRHGGDDHQNFEPNYLSVMNYSFQASGLIVNGDDGSFDYSRFGSIPPLNEADLNEMVGLNGGPAISACGTRYYCPQLGVWQNIRVTNANGPINWDCLGLAGGTDVQANVDDGAWNAPDPTIGTLTGFDDWSALVFNGGSIGMKSGQPAASLRSLQTTPLPELTFELDSQIYRPFAVDLSGDGDLVASPGITTTRAITLANSGALTATITLSYSPGNGWLSLAAVPVSVTLVPSASLSIPVTVSVPVTGSAAISDSVTITATVQQAPLVGDSATLRIHVGPLAQFVAEPAQGAPPLAVTFADRSVGQITSWLWNFGDGVTSTLQMPTHLYTTAGTYSVTLRVSGPDGAHEITRPNAIAAYTPVLAGFSASPLSGNTPLQVTFTDQSSGDIGR